MPTFKPQYAGRYLSMFVKGHEIEIVESKHLEKGEKMWRPNGAYIMFVAEEPSGTKEDPAAT